MGIELGRIPVVLHDGVPFGAVKRVSDLTLTKLVVGLEIFIRPMKVRVEPHHRLMAVNGDRRRCFTQVGTCVLGGRRKGIVWYLDVYGSKKIALVPEAHILPPKEVARSHPR